MAFRDTYLPGQGGTGQAGASSLVLLVDPPGLCLRVRLPTAASAIESGMAGSWPPMAAWLATQRDGDHPELWVRVNAAARLLADDVHAVIGPAVTGICLPKIHTPEQVRSLGELLGAAEQRAGLAEGFIRIVPLLESAAGILSARAIAEQPRVWQLGAWRAGPVRRSWHPSVR